MVYTCNVKFCLKKKNTKYELEKLKNCIRAGLNIAIFCNSYD